MKNPIKLLISLALPILAGGLGTIFTMDAVQNWYPTLIKPTFSPPTWLFGPVWTLLYILMGIACYRIWSKVKANHFPMTIFWSQLALNAIWSPLFFGLHSPLLGLIDIAILWLMIVITIISFWRIDKTASLLLWPYLAWVSFATTLNTAIYLLN